MDKRSIIFWRLFLLFVFTIPLSQFISLRLLIAALVLSFFIKEEHSSINSTLKYSWDTITYFLVLLIGLIYSSDLKMGIRVLETAFSLLMLPVLFRKLPLFSRERLYSVLLSFTSGLVLASCVCLANAVFRFYETGENAVFFFEELTSVIGCQPTYMAYYLCLSITIGLYFLYYEKKQVPSSILIGVLFLLFSMLMLTGGRTAYISVLLVFSFFVFRFLSDRKSTSSKLTFGIIVIMVMCMFVLNGTTQTDGNVLLNDSWDRFVLWDSAINATTSWIWGVGTGDYKDVLNAYYKSHNLAEFAVDSYNAHNQFLHVILTNGFLGLTAIVLLLCRPLYLSVKNQEVLGTLVFFPFLIYGMTEVFLGRFQGVVFFALLHQIFISYYKSLKPNSVDLKAV